MEKIKVGYFAYREWAARILRNLIKEDHNFIIKKVFTTKEKEVDFEEISKPCVVIDFKKLDDVVDINKYDYLLFYGWSWMIPESIFKNIPCVCLHPAPLPKYRGGSPMQNQIINGEKESAVTLFYIDEGLDSGDILAQKSFSLDGELKDIFDRVNKVGTELTIKIFKEIGDESLKTIKQDESQATTYKRRKPEMSEIKIEDIKTKSAEELYNKIRALQTPYPNAYIICGDGKKLFLKSADHEKE